MSKASEEAQKQLDRIVALGYPDVADMSAAAFRSLARPLIRALEDCGDEAGLGTQILLVPTRELVSPESLIARTSINRMAGFTTMPPRDIASFLPQDGFEPPEGPFYLVVEPHTGTCYINREPDVARKLIDSDERLPLTLEEGLAIATQHPEKLSDALSSLNDYQTLVKEKSLGGHSLDPILTYFLALIAFACLSGVYLSIHSTVQLQANLSALGERRSITPTHKLSMILGDLLVLESIHFVNILILELYLTQVLHISLGHDIPKLLLITFMGTLIGICLGILIGCAGKLSYSVKSGIGVLVTLLPSFLAGLMFGGMKNVIEQHCPVINRINPASVLSDAFYCLSVYDDAVRYRRCILILVIMCLLCISFSFLMIRRERYDSI